MKKKGLILIIIFIISLFIMPNIARAKVTIEVTDCTNPQTDYDTSKREMRKKCNIKLNVSDSSYLEYVTITVTANSSAVKRIEINPLNGWHINSSSQSGLTYTYKFASSADKNNSPKIYGPNASVIIGELSIIIDYGNPDDCGAKISGSNPGYYNRTCTQADGKFFGKSGSIVTEEQYHSECDKPVEENPKCGYKNGKYYGPDGQALADKNEYDSKCNPKCKVENNVYYDKDGHEVDKNEYDKQCNPKCEEQDGLYYDPDGHQVDKDTFDNKCNPKCEFKNGIYYDPNGHIVNKDDYDSNCNPKCEVKNDKFYDKNGHEVTEEEYHKSCDQAPEAPKCEFKDDKYYDNNGNEVSKEAFEAACNPKCKVENDKYYDKDGHEVDKDTYDKSCNPKCRVENDKYYDNDGHEVTKEQWDILCPVENPQTGNMLPLVLLLCGGVAGAIIYIIAYRKKIYKL